MKYHYDKIYPYEDILKEIKILIFPTIIERINPQEIKNTRLRKEDLSEIVYTQVMALGYNGQDINATLTDLMPTRNPFLYNGTEEEDAVNMAIHLSLVCQEYKFQVLAFQTFHKMTEELKPHNDIIKEVKKLLLFT